MIRKAIELRTAGDLDYYHDGAGGPLAYYGHGSGKEPGCWMGRGARMLGIANTPVTENAVRLLFDGRDPGTGASLSGSQPEIRAYDLTASAPKSVSIAMALPSLRDEFERAHGEAVRVASAYMEAALCLVRRRDDGIQKRLPAEIVAAPFVHRVSRAGDPHLHTHMLVFALGRHGETWSAIWSKPLQVLRPVGVIYHAELRSRLARMGFSFCPAERGAAEVEGVPTEVLTLLSKRAQTVREHLAASGRAGKQATDLAVLNTRQDCRMPSDPKTGKPLNLEQLSVRWTDEAAAAGFDLARIYDDARNASTPATPPNPSRLLEQLLGPEGVTEIKTSVTFDDLTMALAEKLPTMNAAGAIMAASHLATHPAINPGSTGARMTTTELLRVEAEIERLAAMSYKGRSVLTEGRARQLLRSRAANLDGEMIEAAVALLRSPRLVTVLTGPAGSAKTTVLAACAAIWRHRGIDVHAGTLAALLADNLRRYHGIESSTVAALLYGRRTLSPNCVLIIEEASMVGSRALLRLISLAREAGGRVVLVGDGGQLPEIEAAGGVFAVLAGRPEAIQLRTVVRQHDETERALLTKLRDGEYAPYLDWVVRSGRLRPPREMDEVAEEVATEYVRHVEADGFGPTLLIARSWGQLHVLNRRIRELLREAESPMITNPVWFRSNSFQVCKGERLLLRRNSHWSKLMNGMVGTVAKIDGRTGFEMLLDDGTEVRVPRSYIDADDDEGHPLVAYAYATTAHRAQGMTAERSLVVIRGDESREWAYVALSRSRGTTTVWTLKNATDRTTAAREIVASVLERSEAQETATSQLLPAAPDEYLDADDALDETISLWELLAADRAQVIAEAADSLRGEDDANYGIRLALAIEAWRRQETAALPRWKTVMARLEDVAPLRYDDALGDWLEIWESLVTSTPLFKIVDAARKAVSLGAMGPARPSALPVLASPAPADGSLVLVQQTLDFGDGDAA